MNRLISREFEGSLFRYQLMANIVGVLIVPLFVFTGIKLVWGHCNLEVEIFGVAHGYLYIVYLVMVGLLSFKARLNPLWILAMCAAGLIPGMTFAVEWWIVTKKIHPLMEEPLEAAPAG